jgi:hypothetical protein
MPLFAKVPPLGGSQVLIFYLDLGFETQGIIPMKIPDMGAFWILAFWV